MNKVFKANGKLLLTGEYLVVNGARALVLPLFAGQKMSVNRSITMKHILWKSYQLEKLWFQCEINQDDFKIITTTNEQIAEKLITLFKAIKKINSMAFLSDNGIEFITELDFLREWGWGSSSTLLSLLSQWSDTNPYELYFQLFSGSAFDIAASYIQKPFLYRLQDNRPEITETGFDPPYKENLFFVYLGEKQHSEREIKSYKKKYKPDMKLIDRISGIGEEILSCGELNQFEQLISEHEELMSGFLHRKPVKKKMFSDYTEGLVKSLGAWGGDFALFTCSAGREYLEDYLEKKKVPTLFSFQEIVRNL